MLLPPLTDGVMEVDLVDVHLCKINVDINSKTSINKHSGLVAQLVRALACHARGRGFKSLPDRQFASVCCNGSLQVSKTLRSGFESWHPRQIAL